MNLKFAQFIPKNPIKYQSSKTKDPTAVWEHNG